MKAIVLDKPGSPESLYLKKIERPVSKNGEILVKVHAVGLNPVDYKIASSGHTNWSYPFILGLDVAGVIEEVGEDVTQWKIGDKVFYHGDLSKQGGFAEYAVTTAHTAARLPEENISKNLELVEALRKIADEKHTTVAQLAIAWVLSQGEDVIPLIGARGRSHLQDAIDALNLNLSQEDLQRIESCCPKESCCWHSLS